MARVKFVLGICVYPGDIVETPDGWDYPVKREISGRGLTRHPRYAPDFYEKPTRTVIEVAPVPEPTSEVVPPVVVPPIVVEKPTPQPGLPAAPAILAYPSPELLTVLERIEKLVATWVARDIPVGTLPTDLREKIAFLDVQGTDGLIILQVSTKK